MPRQSCATPSCRTIFDSAPNAPSRDEMREQDAGEQGGAGGTAAAAAAAETARCAAGAARGSQKERQGRRRQQRRLLEAGTVRTAPRRKRPHFVCGALSRAPRAPSRREGARNALRGRPLSAPGARQATRTPHQGKSAQGGTAGAVRRFYPPSFACDPPQGYSSRSQRGGTQRIAERRPASALGRAPAPAPAAAAAAAAAAAPAAPSHQHGASPR